MDYHFQNTYMLIAQSPLIHFQPNAKGVSLRATEVKPKLDAFLILRYQTLNHMEIPEEWFIPSAKEQKTAALNYKIRIEQFKLISSESLGLRTDYDIFYGNMMSNEEKKKPRSEPITEKKGLKIDEKLTVICFNPELLKWIDDSIDEFFAVTNFGTMQNKGFGSFLLAEMNSGKGNGNPSKKARKSFSPKQIGELLTTYTGAKHCYCFSMGEEPVFKQIKLIYAIIKSGVNLGDGKGKGGKNYVDSILFDYFEKVIKPSVNHEKAGVKASGVAPAVKKTGTVMLPGRNGKLVPKPLFDFDKTPPKPNPNYRYVRALLGIGETVTYNDVNVPDGETKKVTVKIAHDYKADGMEKKEKIARFPSPVFFKIFDNNVYFIGTPLNDIICGKTFTFSVQGRGFVPMAVPSTSVLPTNFMDDFMDYAYQQLCVFLKTRTNEHAFNTLKGINLRKVV